jgi:acetyl esterase/lipase
MRIFTILGLVVLLSSRLPAQQEVVPLYPGAAPGSEDWKQQETELRTNLWQTRIVFNVSKPTLSVFRPEPGKANGTAVVICPGGGFIALSIDSEGFDVARWLAARGVTCFVLKYRLIESHTGDPTVELMALLPRIKELGGPVIKMALADGQTAVSYVRQHAKKYSVRPDRIGIMGFSAGGSVTASVMFNHTPETRPDFAAPIYLQYEWTIKPNSVPADAPPIFIAAASDDQLGLAPHSISLYQDWIAAKKSAELHLYARGGHGFGMRKQNLPTDQWIERFADWLDAQGFMGKSQ